MKNTINDFEKYLLFGTSFDLDKDGDTQTWSHGYWWKVSNDKLSVADDLIGNSYQEYFTENAL